MGEKELMWGIDQEGLAGQLLTHVVLKDNNGKEINVITGHLKSGESPDARLWKGKQMDSVIEHLKKMKKKGNIIMGVDLNTSRNTQDFKKLYAATLDEKKGGFLQSAYKLQDAGEDDTLVPPNQHPERKYSSGKWRKGGSMIDKCREIYQTIDFIFHSKEFQTVNLLDYPTYAEIVAVSTLGLPCWKYPSDHFCVGA